MAKTQKKKVRPAATPSRRKSPTVAAPARARKAAPAAAPSRGKLERVQMPRPIQRPVKSPARGPAEDTNEGKYVYCVIKSEQPLSFGPIGIGPDPAEVYTVHFREIAAIVSTTRGVV